MQIYGNSVGCTCIGSWQGGGGTQFEKVFEPPQGVFVVDAACLCSRGHRGSAFALKGVGRGKTEKFGKALVQRE